MRIKVIPIPTQWCKNQADIPKTVNVISEWRQHDTGQVYSSLRFMWWTRSDEYTRRSTL